VLYIDVTTSGLSKRLCTPLGRFHDISPGFSVFRFWGRAKIALDLVVGTIMITTFKMVAIALSITGFAYFSQSIRSTKHHYVGKSTSVKITTRRGILHGGILGVTFLSSPPPAVLLAANLPPPTGADLKRTGSIDTLRPIVNL